jgi:hypothetical protein
MFKHLCRATVLASVLTSVALASASAPPSFLMSSLFGGDADYLMLAQFAADHSGNIARYLNYGRTRLGQEKVVGMADFNDDNVLDLFLTAKDNLGSTRWQIRIMSDLGTTSNGRRNYAPSKTVWLSPINGTSPDAFNVSLGTITNAVNHPVIYLKNGVTGEVRGEEIVPQGGGYSIGTEVSFTPQSLSWVDTISVFPDPANGFSPTFIMKSQSGTGIGIFRTRNNTYASVLDNTNAPVQFGTATHLIASLDVNGDGDEDVIVAPDNRARRAWLLDGNGNRTVNQTILGARPFQIDWKVVAWAGGSGHAPLPRRED